MISPRVQNAYEALRRRVLAVGALKRRCATAEGSGRLVWRVGLPLLAILILQALLPLPFWLRVPVLPAAVIGLAWLAWTQVIRPALQRYTVTKAALLVEAGRPELNTRLVSALETYEDLQRERPHFDGAMVQALIVRTQESTETDDFCAVVDRGSARRQLLVGGATLALWLAAFIAAPHAMGSSLMSMAQAWGELKNLAQKVGGAKIIIDPLDRQAYLKGTDVSIHASQKGFHQAGMTALLRPSKSQEWKAVEVKVDAVGRAELVAKGVEDNFDVYFQAGHIASEKMSVVVTERPRIASLTIEYEFPEYAHRASVVQARSDGNLEAVYGTNVIVTIEANKELKSAEMASTFAGETIQYSVGGTLARGIVRLDNKKWLADPAGQILEHYKLKLADRYGYTNEDAAHDYKVAINKDQAPKLAFVGLPHRSSADEPHVLETALGSIGAVLQGTDDFGISKIVLHYRIEDLETGQTKRQEKREQRFALPRADIPQLAMLRLSELGAAAGDRIVIWAEAEDAYDLEPEKGPHKYSTPPYKFAVVTKEEEFTEVRYRDDWSTQWYDALKVATLSKREIPPRLSPEREPAANVAKKLMDAPQATDNLHGADRALIQDYFESLNVMRRK
jgi:hypothetical protein